MKNVILVKESFNISRIGIVVELQHSENGLKKGTILRSKQESLDWIIKARVLFDHIAHKQKIFENENVEFLLIRYKNEDEKRQSINKILNQEANKVYQYLISPLKHSIKPKAGLSLEILES